MDMETQEQTNWCWAAVAASLHNFLNTAGGLSQGQVATPVLFEDGWIKSDVDCNATPGKCNFPAALQHALTVTGDLGEDGFRKNKHLKFSNIVDWITEGLPVGARIVWDSGGAHFVVVDGYRLLASGVQQVHVQDPLGWQGFQDYDDFVADYPPNGHWQDTYLVKRQGP